MKRALYLLALLLAFGLAPTARANYCDGKITNNSISDAQVAQCVKLPGTFTFATLPKYTSVTIGTTAYTSDDGVVVSTSAGWVQVASSGGSGSVTTLSVVGANGLGGTVASPTTTPAITLTTSVVGLTKGNGTGFSAAASTDLIALWTGTCSSSTFLRGDGACAVASGTGTVTTASVVSANGLAGTVANATSTPAFTLSTSVTGVVKGNGTALSAAASADILGLWTGTCSSATFLRGDGSCATASGGGGITALTSDVTASGTGSVPATIAANAVTNAKAAQGGAYTVKANATGSTANETDVTAVAFAQNFGNSVSVLAKGAVGNGTTDDTTAIQNAVNAGSGLSFSNVQQFTVFFPCPYRYKITTAIAVPPAVKLQGCGRNRGSEIVPTGSGALVIDGTAYGGGFDEFIEVDGLSFDLNSASATNCVYINSAYYIRFRDVWFLNSGPNCSGTAMDILASNDVDLDNVSITGNSATVATNPLGLNINGSSVHMHSVDREYFTTAWQATGTATYVTDVSPYIESSTLNYNHDITSGQVTIIGGELKGGTGAPYLVNIQTDNLSIYNTIMPPVDYTTAAIEVPATASFKNVFVNGVAPGNGNSTFASGANLAAVQTTTPVIAYVDRKTIDWYKQLTSGSASTLMSFKTSGVMNVVCTDFATVDGSGGTGTVSSKYVFTIGGGGLVPNIVVADVSTASNSNWAIALSAPTLTVSTGVYTFGLTATTSGALGTGSAADVWMKCDYAAYDVSSTDAVRGL